MQKKTIHSPKNPFNIEGKRAFEELQEKIEMAGVSSLSCGLCNGKKEQNIIGASIVFYLGQFLQLDFNKGDHHEMAHRFLKEISLLQREGTSDQQNIYLDLMLGLKIV